VNYVDTAIHYHGSNSERFLGRALKGGYREKIKLATKLFPLYVEKPQDFDRLLDEQLKTFIDRCYAHVRKLSSTRQERRAILLIPLADQASVVHLTAELLNAAFKAMTAEILATVVAPGVWDLGTVRGHSDVLAQARQAGRKAVEISS
jgi:diketogulonate reductase-like aldo/keto reductase